MLCKLHLCIIIQFCMIPLHFFSSFQWSLSSLQFSSCFLSFPTPASCRDWRDFPQAQPCLNLESETAQSSSVFVAVSPPDGIKNESCCPEQGMRSVWPVPQASCVPLSCRFLSQSGCGCWVFLLTAGPPALRYLLCSYSPYVCLCPFHALTLWP